MVFSRFVVLTLVCTNFVTLLEFCVLNASNTKRLESCFLNAITLMLGILGVAV